MTTAPVYIFGAGAIGKALAVVLQQQQQKVILIRASAEGSHPYREKIRVLLPDHTALTGEVEVDYPTNHPEPDGIIVLCNKSYGNERMAQLLKGRTGDSPVVLLQNGLGVENVFLQQSFPELYRCVLFATSQLLPNGDIRFKPVTASPIGIIRGHQQNLLPLVQRLNTALFPFREETDITTLTWKKAITNCVFNSVCPLLMVDNGIFHRHPKALALAKEIIKEGVATARLEHILLNEEEVLENLLLISKLSDGQLISTLVDIQEGRPTEIGTLNMEIARRAAKSGRADLTPITKALGEMILLKEFTGS